MSRFRQALDEVYGERIERVIVYGSRARGGARPDSDYDVAVFLHGISNRVQEMYRLADLGTDILYSSYQAWEVLTAGALGPWAASSGEATGQNFPGPVSGHLIHAMPYRAGAYAERTPLMHEIRQDGIDLLLTD
jgi:predicted nucleotidyltransferase